MKTITSESTPDELFQRALRLYRNRELPLGKAAELAGYSRLAFIEKLQVEGEYIFDYTDEEIEEVFSDAEKMVNEGLP